MRPDHKTPSHDQVFGGVPALIPRTPLLAPLRHAVTFIDLQSN